MSSPVHFFDADEVEQLRRRARLDPQVIRQLRNDLLKKFRPTDECLTGLPADEDLSVHSLKLYRQLNSQTDGATKLLFRNADQLLLESVILRIATGRTTLCVSSQVGCAAACDFCATGKMGIARNLTAAEILDQVLQAGQLLATESRRLNNIVFMGMGEPFHNTVALYEAVQQLTDPRLFDRSGGNILVSTVGLPDEMVRFARAFPNVNLALSLHSADQKKRESIIPLARTYPLKSLHNAVRQVQQISGRELMIEYLMLQDINDSVADAERLLDWLTDLSVHVNLIPYNAVEESPHLQATGRPQIEAFARVLRDAGRKTTIRYSLGSDIEAACGQLVRMENRQQAIDSHRASGS
ncbi:MAG: 23S rRNA (adenine(2503)-C(2))-methyltransferase RlmN [Planctomycetaceae bacterium]|nr:23S rRNA (adenine(2503)-C(2))-methyltransferase RlmN [Planctomycetaceae bacterium]